jgi:hypothetical protein
MMHSAGANGSCPAEVGAAAHNTDWCAAQFQRKSMIICLERF